MWQKSVEYSVQIGHELKHNQYYNRLIKKITCQIQSYESSTEEGHTEKIKIDKYQKAGGISSGFFIQQRYVKISKKITIGLGFFFYLWYDMYIKLRVGRGILKWQKN